MLNNIQKEFFETLKNIQELSVYGALDEYNEKVDTIEDLLYNATFITITEILTMIDGYGNSKLNLALIDLNTNKSIKENPFIELHDSYYGYLKYDNKE